MPTSTYLSNPDVTINSVSLTDQCTSATVTYTAEALESTAFGDSARKYTSGLQNNEVTVTLYQSFAATETEATIYNLVGTTTNLVLKPASGTVTATNPSYTLTGAYLESHTPIAASLGELSTVTLTFRGGTLAKAVI
jgi:hypothetical protein